MLAIRLQRTGRKGHAQFRVVVQDSRLTPSSGRVVASLGHYDPHTKAATIEKEKASFYLSNGAQPSDRVARLLQSEGVDLPKWVSLSADKQRTIRNTDKLRKNRPADAKAASDKPAEEAASVAEVPTEEVTTEAPSEEPVVEVEETTASEPEAEAAPAPEAEAKEETKE